MSNRNFTPGVLRSNRKQEVTGHGRSPLGTAMAHREAAPYVAQRPISSDAAAQINKGDREIEDARRRLLDPLGLNPENRPQVAPKPVTPSPSAAAIQRAFAGMEQARVERQAAVARQRAEPRVVTIIPTISAKARAASPDWNEGQQ